MDIYKQFLSLKATDLTARLTASGFSRADAERFIPAASQRVLEVFASPRFMGCDSITSTERFAHLLRHIDVARLALQVRIDPRQSRSGLQHLIPDLVGFLKHSDPNEQPDPGLTQRRRALTAID